MIRHSLITIFALVAIFGSVWVYRSEAQTTDLGSKVLSMMQQELQQHPGSNAFCGTPGDCHQEPFKVLGTSKQQDSTVVYIRDKFGKLFTVICAQLNEGGAVCTMGSGVGSAWIIH